jgi:TonB family protein
MSLLSLDLDPDPVEEADAVSGPDTPPLDFDLLSERMTSPARPAPLGVSAIAHIAVLLLILHIGRERLMAPRPVTDASPLRQKVFLPPLRTLRSLVRLPPPAHALPKEKEKDRISIGPPIPVKQREPLVLHRDDDLTRVARGRTDAGVKSAALQAAPAPERVRPSIPGVGASPILASLRQFESRPLSEPSSEGPLGLPSGTGQQMGPLFFDPEGADFTAWLNHFKNEVYRNWIVPQAASMGMRGQVKIAFTVERNGTVSAIDLLAPSGTAGFDHAAQNALAGSRLWPLPDDFHPPRVTMQIIFIYS